MDFNQLFIYLDRNQDGRIDDHELHALMFCDFVDVKSDPRPYLEVINFIFVVFYFMLIWRY